VGGKGQPPTGISWSGLGAPTRRSRDHSKEESSATRLGEARGPRTTQSRPLRPRTRAPHDGGVGVPAPQIRSDQSRCGLLAVTVHPPGRRWSALSQLAGHIPAATASDAALLVGELVTNSVVHANVGPHRALTMEVTTLDDRLRIAVTDPGSRLRPCVLPPDPETPGGLGLLLVTSSARHGESGRTSALLMSGANSCSINPRPSAGG
jgi:Histidine kinase-like ATPase domain